MTFPCSKSRFCAVLVAAAAAAATAQTVSTLHDFTGTDGGQSEAQPILDDSGNLFGTTFSGGPSGNGTVFELVKGASTYAAQTLYSFSGGSDGASPLAALVMDESGNLYGTATGGGTSGNGTVFGLEKSGSSYMFDLLYRFQGKSDGANPVGGLVLDSAGNLYGTAAAGGQFGSGTVFELEAVSRKFRVLYTFSSGGDSLINIDGAVPYATPALDASGDLFGTTFAGGTSGNGTVFELVRAASGYSFRLLHSFGTGTDGVAPAAGLASDDSGNLYGTTSAGGDHRWGTVFVLSKDGSSYDFRILYSFANGADGAFPTAPIVLDASGNLYGTAVNGGDSGFGTIFKIVQGASSFTFRRLYSFTGGDDGGNPLGGVVLDASGNFYGTTFAGGLFDWGTAFVLSTRPIAIPQGALTTMNTPIAITLSASDATLGNPSFSFAIQEGPAHGTLSSIDGDALTYTPAAGFTGTDSFSFTATDADGTSNEATVTIAVVPPRKIVPVPVSTPAPVGARAVS